VDQNSQPHPQDPATVDPAAPLREATSFDAGAGAPPAKPGIDTRRLLALSIAAAVVTVAVIVAIVLSTGHQSGGWSQAVQDPFLQSCAAGADGHVATCDCVMQKLEGQYNEQEMAGIEGQIASSGQEPPQFQQVAQADIAACS
jgi:hypothetical protein